MASIKTIEIQSKDFFELLKSRDVSMWDIFAEMINANEEQLVVFLDTENKEIAHYILPKTIEQLQEDKKMFADTFKEKMAKHSNMN